MKLLFDTNRRYLFGTGCVILAMSLVCAASIRQRQIDSALMAAVLHKNAHRAESLLKPGADPDVDVVMRPETSGSRYFLRGLTRGRWSWSEAGQGGPVCMCIELYKVDHRPLIEIAEGNNDTDMVRILLNHGAEVNARDSLGGTCLSCAVVAGRLPMAQLLLDHGADVNCVYYDGRTALWHAHHKGFTDITSLLERAGAQE